MNRLIARTAKTFQDLTPVFNAVQVNNLGDKILDDFTELKGLISRLGADCDQEDDINNLFAAVENGLKQITRK